MQKLDGCPKCTARDNVPRSWDEGTGRGDYTCRTCGHSWTTHWEVPGRGPTPTRLDFAEALRQINRNRKATT